MELHLWCDKRSPESRLGEFNGHRFAKDKALLLPATIDPNPPGFTQLTRELSADFHYS
jgi:hypothetical protein